MRRRATALLLSGVGLGWIPVASATPTIDAIAVTPATGSWTASPTLNASWIVRGAPPFLSGIRFEVNTDLDGGAGGPWVPLHTTSPIMSESGSAQIALGSVEGRRALRAIAWNQDGSVERSLGTAMLDRSAPHVTRPNVAVAGQSRAALSWNQSDGDGSGSQTSAQLEIERDLDPTSDGPWISRTLTAVDGPNRAIVDVPELTDGSHRMRIWVSDAVDNRALVSLPPIPVDRSAPTISALRVLRAPTPERPSVQLGYVTSDGPDPLPALSLVRVVDPDAGVTLAQAPSGPGAQVVWVDLPSAEPRRLTLLIADEAGNLGTSAPILVGASGPPLGAASPADERIALLRGARVTVTSSLSTRRVRAGNAVTIEGRLTNAAGQAMAGMQIAVRDRRGRTAGLGMTGTDGSFRLLARPVRHGPLYAGVPIDDTLHPGPTAAADVRVVATVTLRLSRTTTRAGGPPIIFTGRIRPSPQALGLAGKNIVLEWRDPLRGSWRPMLNSRVRADGSVRLRWTFGAGGFDVPVRLRLPAEPGWPTLPATSTIQTIKVQ